MVRASNAICACCSKMHFACMHGKRFSSKMQYIFADFGPKHAVLRQKQARFLLFTMHFSDFIQNCLTMHAFCTLKTPYHAFSIHATMQCIHAMHSMHEPWFRRTPPPPEGREILGLRSHATQNLLDSVPNRLPMTTHAQIIFNFE